MAVFWIERFEVRPDARDIAERAMHELAAYVRSRRSSAAGLSARPRATYCPGARGSRYAVHATSGSPGVARIAGMDNLAIMATIIGMADDVLSKLRYTTVAASEAKNQFGQVLESALRDGAVVITKHDTPKAVLLSIEELETIAARSRLDTLTREFDAKYARMQEPAVAKALDAAFAAAPRQAGAAAVKAARRKR